MPLGDGALILEYPVGTMAGGTLNEKINLLQPLLLPLLNLVSQLSSIMLFSEAQFGNSES